MAIRWWSDLSKLVLKANFDRRGWVEAQDERPVSWDLYWASTANLHQLFGADSFTKLRPEQRVNHFPNQHEVTRKDLLLKNINRYIKQLQKEGRNPLPDILPTSFALPQDHGLFVEECRRHPPGTTYIMKPTSKAQGKGIFLVNKLSQVRAWSKSGQTGGQGLTGPPAAAAAAADGPAPAAGVGGSSNSNQHASWTSVLRPQQENYVVSRYISNPLLLGGKKFDLRLYVVVPCYNPLVVYLSDLGFARFCNLKYTSEVAQLDNMFVHLTNVAVQQQGGADYNACHGNKWALSDLLLYLLAVRGEGATEQLLSDMRVLVVHTLKAVQPVIINDRNCFELYGFDVIIDADLKPWLIEVNASPSLSTTSTADRLLKFKVIQDTLDIVLPEGAPAGSSPYAAGGRGGAAHSSRWRSRVGSMQLIYDESGPLRPLRPLAGRGAAAAAGARTSSQPAPGAAAGGSSTALGADSSGSPSRADGARRLPALGQQPKRIAVLPG